MQYASQQWSLKITKSDIIGRAYYKRKFTSIFIAKMLRNSIKRMESTDNAEDAYSDFLYNLLGTEIHEQLHMFFHLDLKRLPWSEKQVEFWTERLMPYLSKILATSYVSLYDEVFLWIEEKVENKKIEKMVDPCHL